ncbi:MAG: hypothetical protein KAS54_09215, partial [Dehalococcoidia bacterium]|nr:hypothetical protein [Dehalococcoidia bacterium]
GTMRSAVQVRPPRPKAGNRETTHIVPNCKGHPFRSLVKGYLLTHRTEGSSTHTVACFNGILGRFIWHTERVACCFLKSVLHYVLSTRLSYVAGAKDALD